MPEGHVLPAAERLRFAVRDADVLARWTEEDLLAVLPETDILWAPRWPASACARP